MTASEALRRRLEHSDGLIEQGVPVDELVSLVEAAEVWKQIIDNHSRTFPLPEPVRLHAALTALREALEEK